MNRFFSSTRLAVQSAFTFTLGTAPAARTTGAYVGAGTLLRPNDLSQLGDASSGKLFAGGPLADMSPNLKSSF